MPEYIEGGNVGYLTAEQFARFRWAVHDSRKLVLWLRIAGYVRGGEADVRVQTSSERPLGLPPTWIAAEDIVRLLHELNQWGELEDAAGDEYGATVAWQFTRDVETAGARWPWKDRPHRVKYMRCQACNRMSLRYEPPRSAGDSIVVRCRERDCLAVLPELMFERVAVMARAEHDRRERVGRVGKRASGGGDVGEVEVDDLSVGGGWSGGDDASDEGAVA